MQVNTGTAEQPVAESSLKGKTLLLPFILICSLFFLWGMVHNLDGILIPHLKKACQLNNRQSTLVDTAVYLAYFLMAIPAGILLKKFGYKNSIIMGLTLATIGAALFIPAANALTYLGFLGSLFIIGCGIAILETAANPYSALLGDPAGANTRINLAAGFNGVAAFVGPLVGTIFILSGKDMTPEQMSKMAPTERSAYLLHEASSVKMPYGVLAGVLALVAILFFVTKLPEIKNVSKEETTGGSFFGTLRHMHLRWAVVAQFFYVGAQTCVTSFFIKMSIQGGHFDEKTAGYYLSIYGVFFVGGRFVGTAIMQFVKAPKLLAIYGILAAILCAIAIVGKGAYVVYCLWGIGFFMSIMFPTIFGLGIDGLGDDTKPASSWLIMSIVGGAILPYIMGTVIDINHDRIQSGYIIPLLCFLVVIYYGISGYKIKKHLA
ncbi:FHS family L-fucose permease-like MFS transporter [Mucilaginibacter yixingensis]|uniref:FHS family L-fucose permease-like MFS transporter n=1 Tax=Mucilaginibacter yixingensis TaxID=1295612 RepID=A0A2T5JF69_9SPHI|nr:L-fucose:H+ symporter permease [Mucilaginibacter yixingensis]PTR01082.1 FHS family L-fucose permease-like MFS transporter [Mucilaginibacter yixingensis]